jgi:hypothetical protein
MTPNELGLSLHRREQHTALRGLIQSDVAKRPLLKTPADKNVGIDNEAHPGSKGSTSR